MTSLHTSCEERAGYESGLQFPALPTTTSKRRPRQHVKFVAGAAMFCIPGGMEPDLANKNPGLHELYGVYVLPWYILCIRIQKLRFHGFYSFYGAYF